MSWIAILTSKVAASISYLVNEGFESGSEPTNWLHVGTVNYGFTPALVGAKSAEMAGSANAIGYSAFTAQASADFYFQFRLSDVTTSADIFTVYTGGLDSSVLIVTVVGGQVFVYDSGKSSAANTSGSIAINTTIHCWVKYIKGTGSNCTCAVGVSTDGTRPTSGSTYAELTGGNSTGNADSMVWAGSGASGTLIFDHVLVAATAGSIGSNP